MKKTTKILAILMAAAVGMTCLTACGGGKETEKGGKTKLTVGNWPNKDTAPERYEKYAKMEADFEARNPDVDIVEEGWSYDVKTFLPKAEGGTLPDIYSIYFTEASKVLDLGYAADVTDALKKYGIYDQMSDYVMQNASRNGKVYLIPSNMYSLGLMLNLDLFEQAGLMEEDGTPMAPKTFDELIDVAKTITEKTGKAGFIFPTTANSGGWNFTVLAWNFGVDFMEKVDGKWKATFNTPECVEALQYLKDLKWKYGVLPENTLINNSELSKQLGTGQAAMMFGQPAQIKAPIVSYGLSKDSLGFAQMPAGKDKHVTLVGGAYRVMANNTDENQIDGAFRWLEYIGATPNLTEDAKESLRIDYEIQVQENLPVGVKDLSIWAEDSEIEQYRNQLIDEMCNININHVKLYNDKSTDIEYRVEESVCAQDLYSVLDKCIQEVLTNENADCKEVLEKANNDFQKNYLDYEN